MPFTDESKNLMLDILPANLLQLHDGSPGVDGTANAVSDREPASFGLASGGERTLEEEVLFTGLTPLQSVTHWSVWTAGDPDVLVGTGLRTGGASAADSSGEFILDSDVRLAIIESV